MALWLWMRYQSAFYDSLLSFFAVFVDEADQTRLDMHSLRIKVDAYLTQFPANRLSFF